MYRTGSGIAMSESENRIFSAGVYLSQPSNLNGTCFAKVYQNKPKPKIIHQKTRKKNEKKTKLNSTKSTLTKLPKS